MANKHKSNIAPNIENTHRSYPEPASTYPSFQSKKHFDEDFILSLANAYENKRARQVFEWESSQAQNARLSS